MLHFSWAKNVRGKFCQSNKSCRVNQVGISYDEKIFTEKSQIMRQIKYELLGNKANTSQLMRGREVQ